MRKDVGMQIVAILSLSSQLLSRQRMLFSKGPDEYLQAPSHTIP